MVSPLCSHQSQRKRRSRQNVIFSHTLSYFTQAGYGKVRHCTVSSTLLVLSTKPVSKQLSCLQILNSYPTQYTFLIVFNFCKFNDWPLKLQRRNNVSPSLLSKINSSYSHFSTLHLTQIASYSGIVFSLRPVSLTVNRHY